MPCAASGKRQAMEVHFVHKRGTQGDFGTDPVEGTNDWEAAPEIAASAFGVIGVLIKPGAANATFAEIARLMPQAAGGQAPITLAPTGLLPQSRHYFYYEGSLTTPGCSEVVSWRVMRDPITAAPADIARFTALYPQSARPLQPLNRRLLLEG
jgi:carbonic anhydrase